MIVKTLNEYLETLSGYVFDNDKLVTYKWLSKELKIHVNTAKQVLWEFWQKHQKERNIECTFLLMGTLNDSGIRVEVVKESDLSTIKQKFSVIISEHLYSVQRVLHDVELLAISGKGNVDYSAIKYGESIERNNSEMHMLRWGIICDEVQETSEENKKLQLQSTKEQESCTVMESKSDEHKPVATKKNTISPKEGFNNLFKGVTSKQKNLTSSNSSNTENQKRNTENLTKKKASPGDSKPLSKKTNKGGLNTFYEKRSQESSLPSASSDMKNENTSTNKKNEIDECKGKVNERVKSEDNIKHNKSTNRKKRNRSKDTHDTAKKRKRITVQNDSTDTESHSEEEILLLSSPENISPKKQSSPPPPPPSVKNEGGKRKLLKIVDKMFEEDGYLVTKKVHVYESCSEDEADNVQMKEPPKPQIQAASNTKKNTKQTTLTNFFKKS